jgi:uncharacterized membrane protein
MRTWIIEHVDQLIQLGAAAFLVLVALGVVPARKPREANDAFLKKWRTAFLIMGALLAVIAVILMFASKK